MAKPNAETLENRIDNDEHLLVAPDATEDDAKYYAIKLMRMRVSQADSGFQEAFEQERVYSALDLLRAYVQAKTGDTEGKAELNVPKGFRQAFCPPKKRSTSSFYLFNLVRMNALNWDESKESETIDADRLYRAFHKNGNTMCYCEGNLFKYSCLRDLVGKIIQYDATSSSH